MFRSGVGTGTGSGFRPIFDPGILHKKNEISEVDPGPNAGSKNRSRDWDPVGISVLLPTPGLRSLKNNRMKSKPDSLNLVIFFKNIFIKGNLVLDLRVPPFYVRELIHNSL